MEYHKSGIRKSDSGHNNSRAPYEAREMRYAMDCSQGKLGIGLGHEVKAKMPEYGVYGHVLSVKDGHHDVKGKI